MRYEIEALHEIQARYIVEADSHEEAIEKLCNSEPIVEYSQGTFGPDEYGLKRQNIEIKDIWCGGPGPSGRASMRRDWDVEELDGG